MGPRSVNSLLAGVACVCRFGLVASKQEIANHLAWVTKYGKFELSLPLDLRIARYVTEVD